jgi:serine/threonine protein kinase
MDDACNKVKLSDFGWATHTIDERRNTFCGTADYLAPELVKH